MLVLKFRVILFIIIGFFIFNNLTSIHAQKKIVKWDGDEMPDTTAHKENEDSLKSARAHIADSTKESIKHAMDSTKVARKEAMDSLKQAREHIADSTKTARLQKSDSTKAVRQHIEDSTASIRKYHESKHYRDSVTNEREAKTNALKESRQAHMDSVTKSRKHLSDSLITVRKARTDSIKAVQKTRSDSLARIKKYKASRRYSDSVALVKHERMDSIQNAREKFHDSLTTARKHIIDSATASRKHISDSMHTVRQHFSDSLAKVHKARTDSLAKIKKEKEAIAKAKEKKKEEAMKLKLEIKMKQKHEAWSNKSMLKKPFTPVRRFTQNSFTHYNYYYNAKTKMNEALMNMQRQRKENYDSLIGLYPYDPNRDSTMMLADMDSIVHKISVGLQIHDPRVKWANDMYLLLGEAYYYKGNYNNAAIAFRYIISKDEEAKKKAAGQNGMARSKEAPSIMEDEPKSRLEFLKHKSVHNESILWLARTYTESRQVENAESILSLLQSDPKFPSDLKGRLAMERAFVFLDEHNYKEAATQLDIAADDNNLPDIVRMRAAFLHGQLLQQMEDYTGAAAAFEKVLTYFPKIEMDFYSRKYVAFNKLLAGEDIEEAMKPLKKVLNDGKYINYYDQVYYVLGQLAAKANKTDLAINYLSKSVASVKASKKQKAISFAALGDVYYSSQSYPLAKMAYDSAAKYASAAPKELVVKNAAQRNKGLTDITGPLSIIHDQDSLLELASESKREQLSAVRSYLKFLEKQQEDSIQNAENAGIAAASETEAENSTDATWYFSNPAVVQQGSDDFKKKWGTRPLKDNWRRAAAISFSDDGSAGDDASADGTSGAKDNGLPTEASLLAKIPNTTAQKEAAIRMEEKAYIYLAKAYYRQLEDYNLAIHALDTLDTRYPDHNQKEEELYLRYQIAVKQDKLGEAQTYADALLAKFPNSKYADILKPKHSESRAEQMVGGKTVSQYFDATYQLVMDHQYTEALLNIGTAQKQFTDSVYRKRFEILEASAYAGTGNYKEADSVIGKFLKKNPADSLASWATSVKLYIRDVRNGGKPSWYYDTLTTAEKDLIAKKETRHKGGTIAAPPPPAPRDDTPPIYSYHADTTHYCIIVMPGLDSRTAALKKGLTKFDSSQFGYANLDLLLDFYNARQDIMIVGKFANEAQARKYMVALNEADVMKAYKTNELSVLLISAPNYKKMFTDKLVEPYYTFYSTYYNK